MALARSEVVVSRRVPNFRKLKSFPAEVGMQSGEEVKNLPVTNRTSATREIRFVYSAPVAAKTGDQALWKVSSCLLVPNTVPPAWQVHFVLFSPDDDMNVGVTHDWVKLVAANHSHAVNLYFPGFGENPCYHVKAAVQRIKLSV